MIAFDDVREGDFWQNFEQYENLARQQALVGDGRGQKY